MTLYEQFLEILNEAIEKHGNARRLAEAMGMNPNLITRWRQKKFVPALDTIQPVMEDMGYRFCKVNQGETARCKQDSEPIARITALERELAATRNMLAESRGQLAAMERAFDKALNARQPPASEEKNGLSGAWKSGNQDAG